MKIRQFNMGRSKLMGDPSEIIKRANAGKKARSVIDIFTGQPGTGGTYNVFKGTKNDPTTPGGPIQMAPSNPGPIPNTQNDLAMGNYPVAQADAAQKQMNQQDQDMAAWQAAPPKMKAMFHNNFNEFISNGGPALLMSFPGGPQKGGTGDSGSPILD
jgi:hypothetical protein